VESDIGIRLCVTLQHGIDPLINADMGINSVVAELEYVISCYYKCTWEYGMIYIEYVPNPRRSEIV
jgi:hypothetical protein